VDEQLSDYFSKRQNVPPEVKAQLREKLLSQPIHSSQSSPESSRWLWGVVVIEILLSTALAMLTWMFFGTILFYTVAAYAVLSLLCSVVIIWVFQNNGKNILRSGGAWNQHCLL